MAQVDSIEFFVGTDFGENLHSAPVASLHVRVGGTIFPASGWFDFLCVLGWWLPLLCSMKRGQTRTVRLLFMDGPCAIRLKTEDHLVAEIAFERNDRDVTRKFHDGRLTVDLSRSLQNLIDASEKAIIDAAAHGFSAAHPDLVDMRREIEAAKACT